MHYGPVMIDIKGQALSQEEVTLLQHPLVGGVILFTGNYVDGVALKSLVNDIRIAAKPRPLLIAVDHEGGRVFRFKEGFTELPPARYYGEVYTKNPAEGLNLARNAGWVMAAELLDHGIDLSFAPVLDVDRGVNDVIGDRAFGSDPKIIKLLAGAFIEGMKTVGMSATGKHFPGHGGCIQDSHFSQAVDERELEVLMNEDLMPFRELSTNLGAIMPAHVIYPKVDSVPAGFSSRWIQNILRQTLGFKGAIISDCLSMKGAAIAGDFVLRARMALDAGCSMVILCQQERSSVEWLLNKLDRETTAENHQRLAKLAGQFHNTARNAPKPELSFA